jgi:hypothetical protein
MNAWVASIVFAQHVRGVGNGEFGSDCFSDTDGVCDQKQTGIGALEPGRESEVVCKWEETDLFTGIWRLERGGF